MTDERMPTPDELAAMITKALGIKVIKRRAPRYSVEEKRTSLMTAERELWIEVWCGERFKDPYQRWTNCRAAARYDQRKKNLKPLSLVALLKKISQR